MDESISILNFFPPNRGVDFYFELLHHTSYIMVAAAAGRRRHHRHPPL
jgi:hypothetical protein